LIQYNPSLVLNEQKFLFARLLNVDSEALIRRKFSSGDQKLSIAYTALLAMFATLVGPKERDFAVSTNTGSAFIYLHLMLEAQKKKFGTPYDVTWGASSFSPKLETNLALKLVEMCPSEHSLANVLLEAFKRVVRRSVQTCTEEELNALVQITNTYCAPISTLFERSYHKSLQRRLTPAAQQKKKTNRKFVPRESDFVNVLCTQKPCITSVKPCLTAAELTQLRHNNLVLQSTGLYVTKPHQDSLFILKQRVRRAIDDLHNKCSIVKQVVDARKGIVHAELIAARRAEMEKQGKTSEKDIAADKARPFTSEEWTNQINLFPRKDIENAFIRSFGAYELSGPLIQKIVEASLRANY